jgi:hypothetical protein
MISAISNSMSPPDRTRAGQQPRLDRSHLQAAR